LHSRNGEKKPEGARSEGVEKERRGKQKGKIKISKSLQEIQKDFYLCTPETKEGKPEAQRRRQTKMTSPESRKESEQS